MREQAATAIPAHGIGRAVTGGLVRMVAGMMKGSAVSRPENVSRAWAVGQDAAFEAQLESQ